MTTISLELELMKMADANGGVLPYGAVTDLARLTGTSPDHIYQLTKKMGLRKSQGGEQSKDSLVQQAVVDRQIAEKDTPDMLKIYVARLDGAINGIKPFHPSLARFMQGELNAIYRILYRLGYIKKKEFEVSQPIKELSGFGKPGYEEADAEVDEEIREERKSRTDDKNRIIDNVISKELSMEDEIILEE